MLSDGGWAAKLWRYWQTARRPNALSGEWELNPEMFRLAVPVSVLEDDDERLEWIDAMNLCAATMNNKTALLMPDEDDG